MNECSALLLLASYLLNTTFRLRGSSIYLLFCHLSVINLLDLSFSVLLSLLFVANGKWTFGEEWCRVNATVQEFCQLYTLLTLILMSVERAVGLAIGTPPTPGAQPLPGKSRLLNSNRIVGIGAPLGYILTRLALYIACLCVLLVCISLIFKKRVCLLYDNNIVFKLPSTTFHFRKSIHYLNIFTRIPILSICNSKELVSKLNMLDIPQDADMLVTSLKFLFPLLSPICILFWCSDISVYIKKLFSCRTYDPPCVIGQSANRCKGGLEISSLVWYQVPNFKMMDGLVCLVKDSNITLYCTLSISLEPSSQINAAIRTAKSPARLPI
ncbi:unnamed protein product [Angiostrongylus costaricensis]|uniref:G_PROTEIN_RECEP_F1_2 domain-containing protein n=1 Tax=Angiostrongylus costaricensis TaxID=334426 RepID=A0A0R3PXG8_ANGCS|nr:unnamed protein product [Angiostrongylus costaricensis]